MTVWDQPGNYYTAEQYAMKLAAMGDTSGAIIQSNVTEPNKIESG